MGSIDSQKIEDLFNLFNINTNGTVHASHLELMYDLLQLVPNKKELARRVLDMDDGLGLFELTLEQLQILLQTTSHSAKSSSNVDFDFIYNTLGTFDLHKSGKLLLEEFKQVILERCDMNSDELDTLVKDVPLSNGKYISITNATETVIYFLGNEN